MKRNFALIMLTALLLPFAAEARIRPADLRCEYMRSSLCVDSPQPRLSWIIDGGRKRDVMQKSYRILVASEKSLLREGKADLWDSGIVESQDMSQVIYEGKPLGSFQQCYWKVKVWDCKGKAGRWSKTAVWAMGVLDKESWNGAKWIAMKPSEVWREQWNERKEYEKANAKFKWPWYNYKDINIFTVVDSLVKPEPYDPSPLLRKSFIAEKAEKAVLYICGLGYFEAFMNGKRIGNDVLNPAWTDFDKRSLYCTYDVTDLLRKGENALCVILGRGQYDPICNDIWGHCTSPWIDQPKLIAMLRITGKDGSVSTVVTDESWKATQGPVIFDDTRIGEIFDARLQHDGASLPEYDDSLWAGANVVSCENPLRSQTMPAVQRFEASAPVKTYKREGNSTIFDFGTQVTGWARVTLKGPSGARALVDYCELPSDTELLPDLRPAAIKAHEKAVYPDHASFFDAFVDCRQQNGYILSGEGEETFESHFSYKSFQFVRVLADEGVSIVKIEAVPVHTALESVGSFECSNEMVNALQKASRLSLMSNCMSIPTDCPHREKGGWTCDAYLTDRAMMYNFDAAAFYTNWLHDLTDIQDEDGSLNNVAPSSDYDHGVSTTWPAAVVYVPSDLYDFYGDRRVVEENLEPMKKFAHSSLKRQVEGKPGIINDVLGDWVAPYMDLDADHTDRLKTYMAPPEGLVFYGTASHYNVVKNIGRLAGILSDDKTAGEYASWSEEIAETLNAEFLDPGKEEYHGNIPTPDFREAPNAISVEYGFAPDSLRSTIKEKVMGRLRDDDFRIGTGFLGTRSLMRIFPEEYPEEMFKVATQTQYPGWGYMIKHGATSIWEDWAGGASLNHMPFTLISEYFYRYLAGILVSRTEEGLPKVTVKPQVVGDLTWVKGSYRSMYGLIKSEWKIDGGTLVMDVTIPANVEAEIFVPGPDGGYRTHTVGSGRHVFKSLLVSSYPAG